MNTRKKYFHKTKSLNLCVSLLTLFLFSANTTFAQTTSTTTSTTSEICVALNSLNIYNTTNLAKVQSYIKKYYFPKLKITSFSDTQTRFYIRQFQYAFGLKLTGTLNEETLNYLKRLNNCFILEKRITEIQNSTFTKKVTQEDLITGITNWVNNLFTESTATTTILDTQITVTSIYK